MRIWNSLALLVVAVHCFTGQGRADEPKALDGPKVPEGWTFTLPKGDSSDGQVVFEKMECFSCHAVRAPGNPQLTEQYGESGGIGPNLTPGYAKLPTEYLAESIIKAHMVVAAPGYVVDAGQAGMGKYNHFMTIQELVDLVAFIKELP